MPKNLFHLIIAGILISILPGIAKSQGDNPTYDFLNIIPSARASALAGAFETYTNDPNIIFYNPAGLSTITNKQLSAGFGKYLLDINFGDAAFAYKYKDIGWLGVAVKYINYGKFDYTDENGNALGTFHANDVMFDVGYSNLIYGRVNYGINLKFIYSQIADYKSTAIAGDLGLMYVVPSEELSIGFTINNYGKQISSYINSKERLPLDIRLGVSKKLEHLPLRLSVSLSNLGQGNMHFLDVGRLKYFAIGGEFELSDYVSARIGYNNQQRQDMQVGTSFGLSGFSGGIGIKFLEKYKFDYSLNSFGKIGTMHRFDVGYAFN
ncbi:MAG: type IX secretion system protein PorQ [Ignavibacteria bacterium]